MLSKNKGFGETQMGNPPKMAAKPDSPDRKRSPKLSLFVGLGECFAPDPLARSPTSKSPRSFDDGAVGLGIVAAMIGGGSVETRPANPLPVRSDPIPIVPARPSAKLKAPTPTPAAAAEELSESYTCVISHVGGRSVRKRVYFDDGSDGTGGNHRRESVVFFESPPPRRMVEPPLPAADFLSCCHLCRKKLHGRDIFMYRGEKAFCSAECRCQQILSDEQKDKRRSYAAAKPPIDSSSISPCTAAAPLLFFSARVAAA